MSRVLRNRAIPIDVDRLRPGSSSVRVQSSGGPLHRLPGPFMLHCHNLEHEDMAMMADFLVT
ncbi:multicopper oxidase domain-containing protein [Nocardia carnea]|uniref:Multicopper oxidase domain-containing protein n=1 Tax=Nocardia carnea TaxID=37328 RepID=A0ABW7U014_9NOCA